MTAETGLRADCAVFETLENFSYHLFIPRKNIDMTAYRLPLPGRISFKPLFSGVMAVFLMGLSAGAQAADLVDTVTQRGTLKIALEGSYPPFNFKENG